VCQSSGPAGNCDIGAPTPDPNHPLMRVGSAPAPPADISMPLAEEPDTELDRSFGLCDLDHCRRSLADLLRSEIMDRFGSEQGQWAIVQEQRDGKPSVGPSRRVAGSQKASYVSTSIDPKMIARDVIVVSASVGAGRAVIDVLSRLPADRRRQLGTKVEAAGRRTCRREIP
jgi:hypothetical protein